LDFSAYESFSTKHKKKLEHLLSSQTSSQFFQDLANTFKYQKPVHEFNFCNNMLTNNSPTFGNINFPEDKRRMIGRINITSELSRPFDTFFEYEGIVLKKKIDQDQKIILMNQ